MAKLEEKESCKNVKEYNAVYERMRGDGYC